MIKRLMDVILASTAIVVTLPLTVTTALLIRVKLGRPVLFRQLRPGLHDRCFEILKFRTMSHATRADGTLLDDRERLGGLGAWLRSTSIDELPEFLNVLRGEMSLVGPRPLLPEYLPLYSAEQARRHQVKPGITGWAQINGRNAISWEERLALDVWYVDHRSLWLDLRILAISAIKVVRRDAISQTGHVTMQPFTGSRRD